MLIALMTLALMQAEPSSAVPEACAYDREAMLALEPDVFDQDMSGGWRGIADVGGCETVAADLLKLYRRANWTRISENKVHTSYWHEGQLRAAAQDYEAAIPLLMAGVDPNSVTGFTDYAQGTIAFLNHDRSALESARSRLAALPLPGDWAEMADAYEAAGITPQWPPNLDILDGFLACFDRPYDEAYGDCRPGAAPAPSR